MKFVFWNFKTTELKALLIYIIRKKNPHFNLDPAVSSILLVSLGVNKLKAWLRSLRLLFLSKYRPTIFFGKKVSLQYASNIQFGRWNQLEDYVQISALGKQPIIFGDNVKIGAFSRIITSTSFNNIGEFIRIGNYVGIGEYAYLGGGGGLEIGNDCIIGQYFSCHPENHHFQDRMQLIRLQGVSRKGIKIGNNCWLGSKVTILDGVTIGNNCVIAAGAVVTKSMPANSVIGGVPAKVIKTISKPTPVRAKVSSLALN